MKLPALRTLAGAASLALMSTAALADGYHGGPRYEVIITNLSQGQILSPPLVATHPRDIAIFEAGEAATPELARLAQDGDAGPLAGALEAEHGVRVVVADGPVLPGASVTLEIRARSRRHAVSAATMLVSTNDAFTAVNGAPLPRRSATHYTPAWDAGTEANSESCDHIPGPPCGVHDAAPADDPEGMVLIHNGIHGGGGLDPAVHDWRNPVARVVVRRR
jgi:hypothetical protein